MSALPDPLQTQRKSPTQAKRPEKLNKYGRDPGSPSERTRASSDYDTEKGYAPFFHAFLADWPRLASGQTSCLLMNVVLCKSLGRSVKKGEPRPQATMPVLVSDLAALCQCDERSIQRELVGWQARKVAKVTTEGKGVVVVELLYRNWEALPNYKNVVDISTGAAVEETPEEVVDDKHPTRVELIKTPLACRAGSPGKAVKIECGIKSFRLQNSSEVDLTITAMVKAGELVITSKVPDGWLEEAVKRAVVSNGINNLDSPPRHGCPENSDTKVRNTKVNTLVVSHPRAAELASIFDPYLATSKATLLSSDPSCLHSACLAIQDCDHEYLVQFAANRAANPIKKAAHVKLICTEALASWRSSKVLTGAGLKAPIWDEIEAQAQREREVLRVAREKARRK